MLCKYTCLYNVMNFRTLLTTLLTTETDPTKQPVLHNRTSSTIQEVATGREFDVRMHLNRKNHFTAVTLSQHWLQPAMKYATVDVCLLITFGYHLSFPSKQQLEHVSAEIHSKFVSYCACFWTSPNSINQITYTMKYSPFVRIWMLVGTAYHDIVIIVHKW